LVQKYRTNEDGHFHRGFYRKLQIDVSTNWQELRLTRFVRSVPDIAFALESSPRFRLHVLIVGDGTEA